MSIIHHIKSLSGVEALHVCNELIPVIHEIGKKNGIKFFDNYFYRTYAMYKEVKDVWEDIELNPKRTGVDATAAKYSLKDIEFKSGNDDKGGDPLKTSFMWDKQTEEVRRKKTLESDAFVFGRFEHEYLRILLVGWEASTLELIRGLMKTKQEKFLEHWNKNIREGKRGGSDAIRISIGELLQGGQWDLWIRGTWHRSVTAEECNRLIAQRL